VDDDDLRVVGSDAPTYAQLVALVEELSMLTNEQAARIGELREQVVAQAARIAELERRLGQNSQNSSLPPSSDRFGRPRPASLRGKTGRKPGKQPGSPGAALRQADDPDEVVDHVPAGCAGCGADLGDAQDVGVVRRQLHDIPQVSTRVVEHRLHRRRCGCGRVTIAAAPAGVDAPVAYGPNLRALAVYLVVYQHVPVERAARLIADVTGAGCSTGWISGVLARTGDGLAEAQARITTLITRARLVHVDETSLNVGGAKQWLHVACTQTLTAYHLHPSRGRTAVEEFGVLPGFTGVVVHDALSVYDGEDYRTAIHALCGAHLARELIAAAESHPDKDWPAAALDALFDLNQAAHTARGDGLTQIPPQILHPLLDRWRHAILCGLACHPRQPGRKQSKTRNLLQRLRDRDAQVLRFARDLAVPFTNNQAERDLRPVKTQIKISGCHRSTTGARAWLRIRGYISTARKNNINVLDAIRDAITGNPWTPLPAAT
jgi:transposase